MRRDRDFILENPERRQVSLALVLGIIIAGANVASALVSLALAG